MNKNSALKSLMIQATGLVAMIIVLTQPKPAEYLRIFGLGLGIQLLTIIGLSFISKKEKEKFDLILYYITLIAGMILCPYWIELFKMTSGYVANMFLVIPATNLILILIFVFLRDEEKGILKEEKVKNEKKYTLKIHYTSSNRDDHLTLNLFPANTKNKCANL